MGEYAQRLQAVGAATSTHSNGRFDGREVAGDSIIEGAEEAEQRWPRDRRREAGVIGRVAPQRVAERDIGRRGRGEKQWGHEWCR